MPHAPTAPALIFNSPCCRVGGRFVYFAILTKNLPQIPKRPECIREGISVLYIKRNDVGVAGELMDIYSRSRLRLWVKKISSNRGFAFKKLTNGNSYRHYRKRQTSSAGLSVYWDGKPREDVVRFSVHLDIPKGYDQNSYWLYWRYMVQVDLSFLDTYLRLFRGLYCNAHSRLCHDMPPYLKSP